MYTTEHDAFEFNMSDWLSSRNYLGPNLPWRGTFYCVVEAAWTLDDNSFDYAGTHCTGGRSGTHYCYDVQIEGTSIEGEVYDSSDNEITLTKEELEYYSELALDRIPETEEPSVDDIAEHMYECSLDI